MSKGVLVCCCTANQYGKNCLQFSKILKHSLGSAKLNKTELTWGNVFIVDHFVLEGKK